MAITAATTLSGFSGFLTPEQSAPIFDLAYQTSVVQQLAQKVPLGASGVSVPVTTGKLSAGWVSEGGQKPASAGSMTLKTISPKKLAAIAVVSKEVVRANPGGYRDAIRPQAAEAFAIAFDSAALHGTSTPFSTYIDQTSYTQELTGTAPATTAVYDDLVSGLNTLVTNGKKPRARLAFRSSTTRSWPRPRVPSRSSRASFSIARRSSVTASTRRPASCSDTEATSVSAPGARSAASATT
jgi:HK97 family phage major capsid protein